MFWVGLMPCWHWKTRETTETVHFVHNISKAMVFVLCTVHFILKIHRKVHTSSLTAQNKVSSMHVNSRHSDISQLYNDTWNKRHFKWLRKKFHLPCMQLSLSPSSLWRLIEVYHTLWTCQLSLCTQPPDLNQLQICINWCRRLWI